MRYLHLADWLSWQESHHPNAIDLGLGRVQEVASRLGLHATDNHRRVITVAGTNGKGSAVATLESLLLDQGHSVGAYTSPHLHQYNERIRIDGVCASDALICQAFAAIDAQAQDISLTYFEFGTLAALWLFRQQACDYWLLEVGLGGRLDAVNIIDADLAIITSIALDHQAWLGNDLASIGREKAGICRAGKPVIYIDSRIEPAVAQCAQKLGAELLLVDRDFSLQLVAQGQQTTCVLNLPTGSSLQFPQPMLPLPSVVAALVGAMQLGLAPNADWLQQQLPVLSVPGRFERQTLCGRHIILDVAHNPAACEFFLARVARLQQFAVEPDTQVHAVVAMMADKDIAGVLQCLAVEVDFWYPAALPENSRAATPQQLAEQLGAPVCYPSVVAALDAALNKSVVGDSIWVLGSFFTVAAAQHWLQHHQQSDK